MEENQTNVEINVDELLGNMKKTLRIFITENKDNLGALAIETGVPAGEILKVIYNENISIINMIKLYNAIAIREHKKANELIAKIEEAKALDLVIKDIKAKVNLKNVGEISRRTGIPMDEVIKVALGMAKPSKEVAVTICNAAHQLEIETTKKIIERNNMFTPEVEKDLNEKLAAIRAYVIPNPSIAWELSVESGLSTDEIYQISYSIGEMESVKIAHLFTAVQKLKEIRNQKLMDQIKSTR